MPRRSGAPPTALNRARRRLALPDLSRRCAQIETVARESGAKAVCDLLDALDTDLAAAKNGLRELIGTEHV